MAKKLFIALLIIIAAGQRINAQQLVDGIAAIVGKEIILMSEIEQQVQNYVLQNRINVKQNPQLMQQLKEKTLQGLIEQKILLVKADQDTLAADEQMLDQRVAERIRYMLDQVGSEEKLEEVFGAPIKKIRKDTRKILKEQMLVEQVRSMKFRDVKVSRREVENFYKIYRDSLPKMEETVDLSHILKTVQPSEDAQMAAYDKISALQERIKNGEDFATLAGQYSDDPASAKRGGDLGLISRGDFVTEFETVAFSLNDGEISDIVQSQFGFHIIQMIERRGEKVRTRHILIQVLPSEDDDTRIVEELKALREKIMAGEDFTKLALDFSDDDNVQTDKGNLGEFETNKLVIPQFKTIIATMDEGEISEPFKTDYGYHIVRLNSRQDSREFSLENDWQRIQEFALNYKMEKEYTKWLEELRKNVSIEIRNAS